MHLAKFARRHAEECVIAFLSHELCGRTSTANELCALADFQLNVVDSRTNGDVLQRKSVTHLDIGIRTGNNLVTNFETIRCQDVALFTINVVEESDTSAAVRVIFDGSDASRDTILVALEVDYTIQTLVAAALMANGQFALLVAAAFFHQALSQGFFRFACRNFVEGSDGHETATCRVRFKTLYCHLNFLLARVYASKSSMLLPAASLTIAFL